MNLPAGIGTALDVFTGYVMLDAWIANQDRHHENWGAIVRPFVTLAPTFDHGAGLGRNLRDEERNERLATKDQNRTVAAFAQRAQSAFYGTESDTKPLPTIEAFRVFGESAPFAKAIWLERLLGVNPEQVWSILEKIPPERMSSVCKEFTFQLLLVNQHRLLELGNG
jgi:hypothetical protein